MPGTTLGSSPSGSEPVAVATFTTLPARISASVTVCSAVYVFISLGARLAIVHSSPVRTSVTIMSVIVRSPSFLTVIS